MKRFYLALSLLILAGAALLPWACSYPPTYPPNFGGPATNTPTPTATIPPVVLSLSSGSPHYSSTGVGGTAISLPITISLNQSVVWDSSLNGHPLYIDNGTTCFLGSNGGSGNTSFPVTYAFTSSGTYLGHCQIHGACSVSNQNCPASSCTGMAVTIYVP